MRIDLTGIREPQDSERLSPSGSRASSQAAPDRDAEDTAQLSLDHVRVQSLLAQANSVPDVRQEKVAALGRAIQQGSYQVSPEQTAEAMLSEFEAQFAA